MSKNLETKSSFQTGQEEPEERRFSVRITKNGTFVTEVTNPDMVNEFFRTPNGSWFWLSGRGNPFDEDVAITGKTAKDLSGIVKTSQESLG